MIHLFIFPFGKPLTNCLMSRSPTRRLRPPAKSITITIVRHGYGIQSGSASVRLIPSAAPLARSMRPGVAAPTGPPMPRRGIGSSHDPSTLDRPRRVGAEGRAGVGLASFDHRRQLARRVGHTGARVAMEQKTGARAVTLPVHQVRLGSGAVAVVPAGRTPSE
jgi:hypothetical protein